jgi:segregation and condensation protein A
MNPATIPTYQISLPSFSGPLDLLLHLIERSELDITTISLAKVTQQYLEQVERMKEGRVEDLMDFIVIGARLLLIKSRALLPQFDSLELRDGDEEEDPAEALARQLRMYKQFKEAANWLEQREAIGLRTFLRVAPLPRLESKLDMAGITIDSLIQALQTAYARNVMLGESVSVVTKRRSITIEGQIKRLRGKVQKGGRVLFSELLSDQTSWLEMSLTLLAVLELIKRHEINVHQPVLFGPIEIALDGQ